MCVALIERGHDRVNNHPLLNPNAARTTIRRIRESEIDFRRKLIFRKGLQLRKSGCAVVPNENEMEICGTRRNRRCRTIKKSLGSFDAEIGGIGHETPQGRLGTQAERSRRGVPTEFPPRLDVQRGTRAQPKREQQGRPQAPARRQQSRFAQRPGQPLRAD